MQVAKITPFLVDSGSSKSWLFVKVETDSGMFGWGECLGDKAPVVAEAVRSFEHALIGPQYRT